MEARFSVLSSSGYIKELPLIAPAATRLNCFYGAYNNTLTLQQYNTSSETPPGTSQQANYEAHVRLMLGAHSLSLATLHQAHDDKYIASLSQHEAQRSKTLRPQ